MSDKWKAIVRSVIGTRHLEPETKAPCQDYGAYRQYREYLIGAVSDGAGSCSLSEHGSKLAVKVTLKYLTEILENSRRTNPFASQTGAEEIFRELISRVRDEISQKATDWSRQHNEQVSAGQFACTLLAFVVFPNGIAAMQLGDGFIVIREYKRQDYDLLFQPNKGEYVNVTTFVTSPPEKLKKDLQVTYQPRRVSFVCASTDGLEKLALDNNRAYARFFIPREQYIQETVNLEQDRYLEEFLNSDDVNKRTDDDKTILLCVDIDADPAPQITAATPKSKPPAPLPPTTTPPPSVRPKLDTSTPPPSVKPKFDPSTPPPNVKPQPKPDPSTPIDKKPSQPEITDFDDESLSDTNRPSKKRKKKKSPLLVGLFLFSNFLSMYFATVGAIYVIDKIHQNRPDLEVTINNQFSLGYLPSWITWAGVFVLCLYTIFTGLYASDDPSEPDNKTCRSSNKKGFGGFVTKFKLNIGEIFAFCLPLAAILFAFLTAFSLNNTFAVIPKVETKQPSSDKANSNVNKPNSAEKPKVNKDTSSNSTSNVNKPNSGEKPKDPNSKDPATTPVSPDVEPKPQIEPKPQYER